MRTPLAYVVAASLHDFRKWVRDYSVDPTRVRYVSSPDSLLGIPPGHDVIWLPDWDRGRPLHEVVRFNQAKSISHWKG